MRAGPGLMVPGRDRPAGRVRGRPGAARWSGHVAQAPPPRAAAGALALSGTPPQLPFLGADISAVSVGSRAPMPNWSSWYLGEFMDPRGPLSDAHVRPAHGKVVGGVHIFCVRSALPRVTDARAPAANGAVLEARFRGRHTWGTVEAAEQGRSTEFTSRYEVNGILTGASDDISGGLSAYDERPGRQCGCRPLGSGPARGHQRNPSSNLSTRCSTWYSSWANCRWLSSSSCPWRGTLPR